MSLLSPWGLLWLISLPLLVTFYLFRPEPRQRLSTTFFLWKRSQPDSQGGVFAHRLRSNPLLWLQLLVLLLMALYLCRPATVWSNQLPTSSRVVLVVDRSASMQAGEAFPQAVDKALDAVDGLFGGGPLGAQPQVMLLAVDREPQILVPFTSDASQLRQALDSLRATDVADRLPNLRPFLSSLISDQKATVWLFSDHLPSELEIPGLQFSACGQAITANLAVTAFSVELSRDSGSPRPFLYARLENFSPNAEQRLLRVEKMSLEDPDQIEATVWESSILLPAGAGQTVSQGFPSSRLSPSEISLFRVRLLPLPGAATDADGLASDDTAYTVAPPFGGDKLRVALSKGLKASFLVRALSATGGVEVVEWEQVLRQPDGQDVDLLLSPPGLRLPSAPAVRTRFELVEQAPAPDTPVETLRADPDQSLVKDAGAEWNRLRVQRATSWPVDARETVLLSTASGPALTLKGVEQGQPTLCWRFPLAFSSLPLSPALPVIVGRFLDEYSRPASRGWPGSFDTSVRMNRPVGASWRGELSVVPPSGSPGSPLPVGAEERHLPRLSWSGFHQLQSSEGRTWLALNLFSAEESRLPRSTEDRSFALQPEQTEKAAGATRRQYRDASTPLAGAAFLLLLLEAFWFLRRGRP